MGNRINNDLENLIINDYNNGYGTNYISKKYNIHRSTVQRCLQRNNIKMRRVSPHSHYDVHFFDTYTPESCYWAGFIAADGYIRDDNRHSLIIHLCSDDVDHLYKIKKLTEYEGNINQSNRECYISFTGEWYVDKLQELYNIVPRKTYTVIIPENIPKELLHHFVRGYFDGDGCIYSYQQYPRINFSSGSSKLLDQLRKIFYTNGIIVQGKNDLPPISNIQIGYSGSNAMKILNWMYDGSTELTRLDRKYNKYLYFLNNQYDKIDYKNII